MPQANPQIAAFARSSEANAPDTLRYVVCKRIMDVAMSAAGLVLFGPVMLAIALTTWIRSGRPVLLMQERVGRGGRRFPMYKFRSLATSALASSDRQWTAAAPDGWGRFLRRTGLDELPQLLNVLRGEMSLVGPRPERPHFAEQFGRELPSYPARHRLQAGITGWAYELPIGAVKRGK